MAAPSWLSGVFGDWNTAALWSTGSVPGALDTVVIGATGTYDVTLFGQASAASLTISAPGATFYDAGSLALGGLLNLQAGTLSLAYGSIAGGTLALSGGTLLAGGGTLDGVAVRGVLGLQRSQSTLFIRDGLSLTGTAGSGAGSIALTGNSAALDFVGSQSLDNAVIDMGAGSAQGGAAALAVLHDGNAQAGATLTLGANLWLRDLAGNAVLSIGASTAGTLATLPDALVNLGTMTVSGPGSSLLVSGTGSFVNRGSLAVANGATLTISTGGFANNGSLSVSNATLALGGSFAAGRLGSLGSLTMSAGTVSIAGTADNRGGTLLLGTGSAIGRALGAVSLAGTILGGSVQDGGGGLDFGPGSGVLDGVAYQGTIDLSHGGAVTLTGGASVASAGGAGIASILDTGAGSALFLRGTESLGSAVVALGNAAQASVLATSDSFLASTATTAVLGASLTIQQAGLLAEIDANGSSPVPGFGPADTLIAGGLIAGAVTGGRLVLGGFGTIVNQGTIAISNGDTLAAAPAVFSNTGTILVSSGATAILGGPARFGGAPAPFWSNTGQIAVSGGTLVLAGSLATAQLGSISMTTGAIQLAGTLANAGATLALGAPGTLALGTLALGLPALSLAGTIVGGTIADATGVLNAAPAGTGVLDGVTIQGTLALTSPAALLRVRDGMTVNGTLVVTGAGADLAFWGTQELDGTRVRLGNGTTAAAIDVQHDYSAIQGSTLTLGAGLAIAQSGALAAIGLASDRPTDAIVNLGTITAAASAGTFTLGGNSFVNQGRIAVSNGDTLAITAAAFSNTGVISVSGATLSIGGSLTLGALGTLTLSNASVSVGGTLDLAGGTLAVGTGSAFGHVALTGTITGGTVTDPGGVAGSGLGGGIGFAGGATLAGVTYRGLLDLSRPFAQLDLTGGTTLTDATGSLAGSLLLTGAASRLVVTGSQTLDNFTATLGSGQATYLGQHVPPAEIAAATGSTLTLGAGAFIKETGLVGMLGDAALGLWTDGIVNAGRIESATRGGTLVLGSSFLTNTGTMTVDAGAEIQTSNVAFSNTGTIAIGASADFLVGLYNYFAAPNAGATLFTNAGTVTMQGSLFQAVTANGLFPWVPFTNQAGGLIRGSGIIAAPVANAGTIEASGGVLSVYGPLSGAGAVLIDPGASFNPVGAAAANVHVQFVNRAGSAGGTLSLEQPSIFAGTIANYTTGDTIDLPSMQVNVVAISNGTLVANTPTQTIRFLTAGPVGGALSVGHDKFGGATIAITTQSFGGSPVAIAATQPAMLFWASGAGDIFTGTTANLNGVHINNWLPVDSLDFTDLAPAGVHLAYATGSGTGLLTVSSGTHSAMVTLFGAFQGSAFAAAADGHGGTVVTYHP